MPELIAKRTLVKSPPELWEELSEVQRLAKHLGAFGEIKITKLEPEHTVAWKTESATGTVSIEASGWGTKVTLQAELPEAEPQAEAAAEPEAETAGIEGPEDGSEPEPPAAAAVTPEPDAEPKPDPVTDPEPSEPAAAAEPKRRRGFWAWLFRPRSAAQMREPEPIAAEAESSAPVEPAEPVIAEPELAEPEPVVAEAEPVVAEPEPVVAEPEPVVAEAEPVVAEAEPVVAEAEPVVAEPELREPEPVIAEPVPDPVAETEAEPAEASSPVLDEERARAILDGALDALGAAHHRPFSRA